MIQCTLFNYGDDIIPISPLQFQIKEIKATTASKLNECWHSTLPRIHWANIVKNPHYACYGALFNGKWWAVGIWSSPIARFKNGKEILELRRLAINSKCPQNTASRMISVMIKMIKKKFPDIKRLISYQDTNVHKGTIYKASNWKAVKEVKFRSWSSSRKRTPDQSRSDKIRWEFELK